jgi:integrase
MADINFFLKDTKKDKTTINVIVRYKGERFKSSTGLSVETKYFDKSKHRCKLVREYKIDAQIINQRLDGIEAQMKTFFNRCDIDGRIPTKEQFKSEFEKIKGEKKNNESELINYFEQYLEATSYKEQTVKKYRTTINWLKLYEKEHRTNLTFKSIDLAFYRKFRKWMLEKSYKKKIGEEYEERNYSLNYFGSIVKCIKVVLNDAAYEHEVPEDFKLKKFKTEAEESDSIYLTIEELKKIHALTPTFEDLKKVTKETREHNLQKKIEAIVHDKNAFLIGAFTVQRVSDYSRIKEFNIKGDYIRYKPTKGTTKNEDVIIPMHPIVREILESGFDFNKPTYDQKINRHIKEVCKMLEFDEEIPVTITEGGKQVTRTYHKYELVKTHTARRSGATNMSLAGIPDHVIMRIGGWKSERSFRKYIKIDNQQNAELIKDHPFFKE